MPPKVRKEHHRRIIDYLKSHGAENVEFSDKRRHARIWYTWNGVRSYCTTSSTPSDHRSTANAIASIRRKMRNTAYKRPMGEVETATSPIALNSYKIPMWNDTMSDEPPPQPEETPMAEPALKIEEIMEQPPPETKSAEGYLGYYTTTKPKLRFLLPEELVDEIGNPSQLMAYRNAKDIWQLKPDIRGTNLIKYTSTRQGMKMLEVSSKPDTWEGLVAFGMTPTDCVVVDNTILVSIDLTNLMTPRDVSVQNEARKRLARRREVGLSKPQLRAMPPKEAPPPPPPPQKERVPISWEGITGDIHTKDGPPSKYELRKALDVINRAEEFLPMRLFYNRGDQIWEFKVHLDD